jgi:hypothetical protein
LFDEKNRGSKISWHCPFNAEPKSMKIKQKHCGLIFPSRRPDYTIVRKVCHSAYGDFAYVAFCLQISVGRMTHFFRLLCHLAYDHFAYRYFVGQMLHRQISS